MSYIVRNKTVIIGNISPMQADIETLFIHILEGRDSMRPLILRSVPRVAWIFCGIAWIFLFIASFFRYILYAYLCRKYKEKRLTSIDVLIMVQSLIQHLANVSRIRKKRLQNTGIGKWEVQGKSFVFSPRQLSMLKVVILALEVLELPFFG